MHFQHFHIFVLAFGRTRKGRGPPPPRGGVADLKKKTAWDPEIPPCLTLCATTWADFLCQSLSLCGWILVEGSLAYGFGKAFGHCEKQLGAPLPHSQSNFLAPFEVRRWEGTAAARSRRRGKAPSCWLGRHPAECGSIGRYCGTFLADQCRPTILKLQKLCTWQSKKNHNQKQSHLNESWN